MRLPLSLLLTASVLAASLTAPAAHAAAPAATQPAPVTTERVAGADRFATSVAASREMAWQGDTVFLASGLGFADALAAAPVAAAEDAHLLLTRPDRLDEAVLERLQELAPREIVLVGSSTTIHDSVRSQLGRYLPGSEVTRIGGADRVHTSLLLMDRLLSTTAVHRVWIASGHNFPDALVAASVAGGSSEGIVLLWHGGSESDRARWIERVTPYVRDRSVAIAGGSPSVGWQDEEALHRAAGGVESFRGADRYETARAINDRYFRWQRVDSALVATGENFPDALAGAVLAAARGIPLYLSPTRCHPRITRMLELEAAQHGIATTIGLGSPASLSAEALGLHACQPTTPLQQSLGSAFGTFPSRVFRGDGDAVIDLGRETGVMLLDVEGAYGSRLAVERSTADGRSNGMLVEHQNLFQTFRGTIATEGRGSVAATDRYLEVSSDGPWSIRVSDATHAPELSNRASGEGQAVLAYGGASRELRLDVDGFVARTELAQLVQRDGRPDAILLMSMDMGEGYTFVQLAPGPALLTVRHDTSERKGWHLSLR